MIVKTDSIRARYSRRAFLQGLGGGAALLPLIGAERAIAAGPNGAPKRLVLIACTNGVAQPHFWPADADPTASDILKPLAPFKSKVLLPAGLDIKVMLDAGRKHDGHFSYPTLFTGTYKNIGGQNADATGPSLDYVVSQAFAKNVNLPIPLLNTAAVGGQINITFSGPSARNSAETSPARLFDRLIQRGVGSGGGTGSMDLDLVRARRASVLDAVRSDLTAFQKRLGTDDRAKIDSHLESLRQLEKQLTATTGSTCALPSKPSDDGAYATKVKLFNQLVALAIRCDATRVATMVWGADGAYYPRTFDFIGVGGIYHDIAHRGASGYGQKVKIDTWLHQQLADFAKLLEDTSEGGKTALDNSLVVMTNDMDEGANHYPGRNPWVLVGGAGGAIKTGRVVRLGSWAGKTGAYWRSDSGVPHNKLLATIGNAMGVPMDGFGTHRGVLPELLA